MIQMQAQKYNRQHFPNKIHEYDLEYQQSDLLSLSCHYASHNTTTIVTHTNKKKTYKIKRFSSCKWSRVDRVPVQLPLSNGKCFKTNNVGRTCACSSAGRRVLGWCAESAGRWQCGSKSQAHTSTRCSTDAVEGRRQTVWPARRPVPAGRRAGTDRQNGCGCVRQGSWRDVVNVATASDTENSP